MLIRPLLATMLAAISLASGPAAAQAAYPTKPVTLVVGYPPGGVIDTFSRALGERLSQKFRQPFVIENRAGASENIAAEYVARAKPDGYTLLASTEAPLTQNQFLYRKLSFNPETDLAPVSLLATSPMLLAVSPNFPASTVAEFIAVARSRTGNPIKVASYGNGTASHLSMAMFAKAEGFEWLHVPYKGIPPILPDLMEDRVDATLAGPSILLPYIKTGKIKVLALHADTRIKLVPAVPTFKELGIKDFGAKYIITLTAPAGTPKAITEELASAARSAIANDAFRQKFMEENAFIGVASSPDELSTYLVSDRRVQAQRIKDSGAKLD